MKFVLAWWCTPCQKPRAPIRYAQIGSMCPTCRSGRIAPLERKLVLPPAVCRPQRT